jgi:putative hemolysin
MGEQRPIADRLLDFLGVTFTTSEVDLARIPRSGPAIVTANHPFGILEGAILASMLRRIRPDVRFLANGILNAIPEVRGLLIPVDPIHGPSAIAGNGRGLRASLQHLRSGGMLVIFPAIAQSPMENGIPAPHGWWGLQTSRWSRSSWRGRTA